MGVKFLFSGGAMQIGDVVIGGTTGQALFIDSNGKLAGSPLVIIDNFGLKVRGAASTSLNNQQGALYFASDNQGDGLTMDAIAPGGVGFVGRASRGTQAARTDVQSSDVLAFWQAKAFSGGNYFATAEIDLQVDGAFTSGQRPPSKMAFYTNIANGAQTGHMILYSTGALVHGAPPSAPATIFNSSVSMYLDEVGNNLKFAVQYSNGTGKTGTLAVV